AAAAAIRGAGASLRASVLVGVPFIPRQEQQAWVQRSIAAARACGARLVSLIPLRRGNGAIETLERTGDVVVPGLTDLEDALDAALATRAERTADTTLVCVDTWNLEALTDCAACHGTRVDRLRAMNLTQQVRPRVPCHACDRGSAVS